MTKARSPFLKEGTQMGEGGGGKKKKKRRRQGVRVPTERSKGKAEAGSCTRLHGSSSPGGGGQQTRTGNAEMVSKTAYFPVLTNRVQLANKANAICKEKAGFPLRN